MEHPYPPERTGRVAGDQVAHSLVNTARDLLGGIPDVRSAWRSEARLELLRRGDRNTVFRAVAPAGSSGARTIVLKLAGDDAALAESDLRCMQALSGLGVVPDVLADSAEARGYVMADAGDDTLERLFERGAAYDIPDAMRRMGRVYARLHVEGRALVGVTAALRDGELTRELVPWMDGTDRALRWLGLTSNDVRARRALARVGAAWYAPRATLTLTHGDPAPSNILLTADGEARLVDFEYGSPRHPLYDLTAWDSICPLPQSCVDQLREAYAAGRAALGWPLEGNELHDYAAIVTYRLLALLSWLPASAREQDAPWVESWSVRHALVAALERLAARGREDADIAPLAECAGECVARWRSEWPEVGDALPAWPAFTRRGASPAPR